ncbi:aldose epimerase family protein [Chryseobacterium polytrichastri]|uniref:Aldose 1-epimerase n=1 Tax=Chryseobacterium polytrichastri TaxID=1302687 RepID=A0A1M7FJ91_9FLAO|nr:aldose epimerase family protein [Chryseobacterium polytrichastri]SHM04151.1 aldose 1-epimerase [Chryseobacterium polytrichastri]
MKNIEVSEYGVTPEGIVVKKFTVTNKNGMQLEVINYGGIITSLTAPDRNGQYKDVVLGFTKPEDYFTGNSYFLGAIVGRFANRIAGGKFSIEGKTYELETNNSPNHLHGGNEGFSNKIWEIEAVPNSQTIKLSYTSKDREEGYPGELKVTVLYTLTDDDALEISYEATTDKPTIVNLSQHSYFNLSGDFTELITGHELQLYADYFIPTDNTMIPTGELKNVEGTPFDFRIPKLIGKDIEIDDEQLKFGSGYDHCWVPNGKGLRSIAEVYHAETERMMEVLTDQPGVQLYCGNFLDGKYETKTGGRNERRTGLCLETQHFPDAPNQSHFPSVMLIPGEKYQSKTIYKFSVK